VPPVNYARLMAKRGRLYLEPTASGTGDEGHAPSPSEESSSVVARFCCASNRIPVLLLACCAKNRG
jgi:hypothetical protein